MPALRKFSYTDRLKKIGLTTLQTRKASGDMIEVYKIMTGKDKIDKEQFFPLADSNYGLRGHSLKIDQTWISESTFSANEWSTHGINSLNMSWTRRP